MIIYKALYTLNFLWSVQQSHIMLMIIIPSLKKTDIKQFAQSHTFQMTQAETKPCYYNSHSLSYIVVKLVDMSFLQIICKYRQIHCIVLISVWYFTS